MNPYVKLLLITVLVTSMLSCNKNQGKSIQDMPVPVTITKITPSQAVFYNSYPANVVALKEVELRPQVSGYVTGIYFTEGQVVHTGDKLYEIDRRKYEAALSEASSNVKIAEANLEKAQRDADRYIDLSKQNAVAKQMLDDALTDLKNAQQQVTVSNAKLLDAKTDFEYSMITAPFDGTIGFSLVKLGASVSPGQTLLNTLSSDDPIGVDFEISETELERFQILEQKSTSNKDSTFRLLLPNNKKYPFFGKISVIDRAVDQQTGTIRIRVTVPNKEKKLRPGMSCKLNVLNDNSGMQLQVPFKAIVEQLGEYFIFIAEGNKVKQVRVTLGPQVNSKVIVLKGLEEGESIVVDGVQKLHDGIFITLGMPQAPKH